MQKIILFDGICNFCNWNVQFIMKRDRKELFKFASLQSETGQKLLIQYGIETNENSLILIENGEYFSKSTAVFKICKSLTSFWKAFSILIIIPKRLRDFGYTVIANNRYKLFGKKNTCIIPSPEVKKKVFIAQSNHTKKTTRLL